MALADDFQELLDSLPADWTDIVCDLRIADESRYIDAAVLLSRSTPSPTRRRTGTSGSTSPTASATPPPRETVKGMLAQLDEQGIAGELIVREVREGRAEVVQMWGRPETVRREFRARRSL